MGAQLLLISIKKTSLKSLVNELIRRPASVRYTVVLRQSVPEGVNIKMFVVPKHNLFVQTFCVYNF